MSPLYERVINLFSAAAMSNITHLMPLRRTAFVQVGERSQPATATFSLAGVKDQASRGALQRKAAAVDG